MKHLFTLLLLLHCMTQNSHGQPYCPNSDFSEKTFDHWQPFYGFFNTPEKYQGQSPTRHTIIYPPAVFDENAPDVPTIPPGDQSAARLGNSADDGQAEVLKYTIDVTPDNNLFIYKYAVVLQDPPGHDPDQQPSFTIEVRNQQGQLFDSLCGYYYVYAQPGLPGWETNADQSVVWKNWTTVGLDLSQFAGDSVTIVFTTRDCSQGAHYGYAYLSTHCEKMMLHAGGCIMDSVIDISAPQGFRYLWNTGDTTQHITISHPAPSQLVTCELTAVNGCKVTISTVLDPTILSAEYDFVPRCSSIPVVFTDQTTSTYNPITEWHWDFDDGKTDSVKNPQHIFENGGLYHVRLVTVSSDLCSDTIMHEVLIEPFIEVDLGEVVYVKSGSVQTLDAGNPGSDYLWSTGDTTQTITVGGDQTITVAVTNSLCSDYDTVLIREYPKCIIGVPSAFSPNGDGSNDVLKTFGSGVQQFELQVYDRSGQLVYKTSDLDDEWDGTFEGRPLATAVFNYLIRGKCIDGGEIQEKGTITIMK